jgi:hypothetical protein
MGDLEFRRSGRTAAHDHHVDVRCVDDDHNHESFVDNVDDDSRHAAYVCAGGFVG